MGWMKKLFGSHKPEMKSSLASEQPKDRKIQKSKKSPSQTPVVNQSTKPPKLQ